MPSVEDREIATARFLGELSAQMNAVAQTITRNHTDSLRWIEGLEKRLEKLGGSVDAGVETMRHHGLALVRVEGDLRAMIETDRDKLVDLEAQVAAHEARLDKLDKAETYRDWWHGILQHGWKLFLALAALGAAIASIVHDLTVPGAHFLLIPWIGGF